MTDRYLTPALAAALLLWGSPGFGVALVPTTPAKQPLQNQSIDSAAAIERLGLRLDAILQSAGLAAARKSLSVYSLDNRKSYYDRQSKTALTPASTTKLFSTFTAFRRLGADGTIPTKVFTDAKDIENGVIHGNLYIVGHGDALLSINDIETLADKISALGVKKIEGAIYADGSFFDAITERHIYSGDNDVVEPLPPITALGMNRNSVSVLVSAGNPPRVQTLPPSDAFRVITVARPAQQLKTVKPFASNNKSVKRKHAAIAAKRAGAKKPAGRARKAAAVLKKRGRKTGASAIRFEQQRYGDAMPLPPAPKKSRRRVAAPRVSVQSRVNESGVQEFVVSGSVGRGGMYTTSFVMKNPDLAVAGALRNRLTSGGIVVGGGVGRRAKPEGAMVLAMFERPLTEICALVNKNSDNYLAEHVFKFIGAHAGGQKSTAKRATEVVKSCLEKDGIFSDGLCMADGSGLCRKNLISAATEIGLLDKAAQVFGDTFEKTLAVAGVDGTLRRRMKFTEAEKNVHAKTGTLRNASALSGYVRTAGGERLAFSFIFNGGSVGQYKRAENELAAALAKFSYTAAEAPPEPPAPTKPAPRRNRR